jgi:peptidoglycan/xylan/chitin deacetylase (PgdA/CDA1 family)
VNTTSCRSDKLALARLLSRTPWNVAASAVERRLGIIRVFNLHGTPPRYRQSFGQQLDHLLARYDAADPHRLEEVLARGPSDGRALALFTFDDGLRNHFTVAAEELEERGARGIFSIPVTFPSVPIGKQAEWFRAHVRRRSNAEHSNDDDLYAVSWEQVRQLRTRGHRICCHSLTHEVLRKDTPWPQLKAEIVDSRRRIEHELGGPVDGFCWPSERDRRAIRAQQLVAKTYGYALVGDTRPLRKGHDPLDVNRTRLEASWPVEAVDLQVSGLIDAIFVLRRLRASIAST